ncbi:unnamed protein product [Closterium sp. Naga37s-1]|nr:unnamed protein product [Closterium sp. Naga37s-1]
MPPKGKPTKPAARMDPAAAAAPAAVTTPAPATHRPISATAVPPKSSRTIFAEEETSSLTLSAKLAAIRIEQAAGGGNNDKKKDAVFKDAVSEDPEGDAAGEEDDGEASGSGPRYVILDDEDDGLIAHDPNESFEDKAKGELAAKLKFPLTLLIPNEHMQELPFMEATVKGLLVLWKLDLTENAAVSTKCQELAPAYLSKKLFGRLQVSFVNAADANFVWRQGVDHLCRDGKYVTFDWQYPEDPSYSRRKMLDPAVIEVLLGEGSGGGF